MKELKSEHPELGQEIIKTIEAGNVLGETQQHEQALIYYDQAWDHVTRAEDRLGNSQLDCFLSRECTYGLGAA